MNYYFDLTCGACPEQYDVYENEDAFLNKEEPIAYVRLRWGYLYCDVPYDGERVYEYMFENDGYKGCFDSDEERDFHLEEIRKAIYEYLNKEKI